MNVRRQLDLGLAQNDYAITAQSANKIAKLKDYVLSGPRAKVSFRAPLVGCEQDNCTTDVIRRFESF